MKIRSNVSLPCLLILLLSTVTLSGCFFSFKPIYNVNEQAKAEKVVEQFHKLHNESRYDEIYALVDESAKARMTKEQFLVAARYVTDRWGKAQNATLSEAKVFPGPPIQVRMIYNVNFENGEGQEWFTWAIYGDEAKLMHYEPKPGFDKRDATSQATGSKPRSDRFHDGLFGPVKKVFAFWTPISGSSYPDDSKCRELTNEYDKSGRITRHSVYPGACGSDEMREDYTYSADGNRITKTQTIRGANSPPPPPPTASSNTKGEDNATQSVLKYDDSGLLIERSVVQSDGQLSYKNTYAYDSKDRLIETTGYDGDGRITDRRVYLYSGDEPAPSRFTYYRGDGRVGERTTYTDYEFNSKGDWIKRKETKEETPNRRSVSMSHREIEYYPGDK